MFQSNSIICNDCLNIMKTIPNKSIDLILTDPPYGIKLEKRRNSQRGKSKTKANKYDNFIWDNIKITKAYFDEMIRISKNQIIFGGNYFIEYLTNSSCWLVWDKDNGNNCYADCELAWTSFNSAVRKFKFRWYGMLQEDMKNKQIREHPTEKPIKLLEQILLKYSKENDLICDPFAGSFTTAIACLNINRKYICIEKEENYFNIGKKRIEDYIKNKPVCLEF
jgi:site-specific DNA-methyltransferase (adenine-specific)